jgi:hypothetical protein
MSKLVVRPYPVHALVAGRDAISLAARGDVRPLQALYAAAVAALAEIDPDEVEDLREPWARAGASDKLAARAALEVADTWEGIVSVGSLIQEPGRFRGFAWMCAQVQYGVGEPSLDHMARFCRGDPLPRTSIEDTALYAALPALIGLGPELPEELPGPALLTGESVRELLGLPEGDWAGIDPIDGVAVSPETCLTHLAALPPAWRSLVERSADRGLLIRPDPLA